MNDLVLLGYELKKKKKSHTALTQVSTLNWRSLVKPVILGFHTFWGIYLPWQTVFSRGVRLYEFKDLFYYTSCILQIELHDSSKSSKFSAWLRFIYIYKVIKRPVYIKYRYKHMDYSFLNDIYFVGKTTPKTSGGAENKPGGILKTFFVCFFQRQACFE